jgi:hypothetical protein
MSCMLNIKKIFAIIVILTFLATIPLAFAENGQQTIKVTYELKADHNAKPPRTPGGGKPGGGGKPSGGNGGSVGYSLMGVSWTELPTTIEVDKESNSVNSGFYSAVSAAVSEWDDHTGTTLVSKVTLSTSTLSADTNTPDYVNEVLFGVISDNRVIAQTTIWYNSQTKAIVDFDIVFNVYYSWGDASGDSTVMDVQNIATHEFGHGFGLGDLYQRKWSDQTMYGYAGLGETMKRTLESGDIVGIQTLYGP